MERYSFSSEGPLQILHLPTFISLISADNGALSRLAFSVAGIANILPLATGADRICTTILQGSINWRVHRRLLLILLLLRLLMMRAFSYENVIALLLADIAQVPSNIIEVMLVSFLSFLWNFSLFNHVILSFNYLRSSSAIFLPTKVSFMITHIVMLRVVFKCWSDALGLLAIPPNFQRLVIRSIAYRCTHLWIVGHLSLIVINLL